MKFSSKKGKVLIGIIVLILVIFLLNFFQKEVRSFFYTISSPIQKVLWRTGDKTSDFLEMIIKIKSLKKEADSLGLKNQELLAQIAMLRELKRENENLRQALEIGLQKDFKLAMSQIIGKDVSQDFILIDKGFEDSISEGLPVITQQKVLVGKISEVYKNSSKIMLLTHKESSFDAEIQGPEDADDISGVIKGRGNFKILFDFVPREKDVSQRDIVITSALGGIFPKGLLVGEIKEVKKSDVEPFQQAEIDPFFDIKNIEKLFVIIDF